MEDWPSAAALQGEAANHRELRRSRAGVVSVADTARHKSASGVDHEGERKRTADDVSKAIDDIKAGVVVVAPG